MKQKTFFKCLGGGHEVGRSSFLIDCGEKFVLDRGVKLSPDGTEYPEPLQLNIDAVIISHSHLDHSGNLPPLFLGNHAMTYMTAPTLEVSKILWFDSLKIAGFEGFDSGYSKEEVKRVERYTFPLEYNKQVQITARTALEFFDAGHISGSAMSKLYLPNGKNLLYTGDFNGDETRLYKKADTKCGKIDYLIIESTYGDRNHPDRRESEKRFVDSVKDVLDNGGHCIISAFAVGRSQEMIDILTEHKVNAPIYLDGMGQKAANVMMRYPNCLRNPKFLRTALMKAHWVKSNSFRKKVLKEPSVVVTTSGMLSGGPVNFYLKELYDDKKSKLFLTGFQVEGTPGRILLDTGRISLDGESVEVKMQCEKFDFSAHSDKKALFKAIKKFSPEKVVCVHGDSQVIEQYRQDIEAEGFEAFAPRNGEEIEL